MRATLVEVAEGGRQPLEGSAGENVLRGRIVHPERVDGHRLLETTGIEREDRGRGVGDHVVLVVRASRTQAALTDGPQERRLDLVLAETGGAERREPKDVSDRRWALLHRVPEHDRPVTEEREDRRLGGQERRGHEPAALLEPEQDVRRAGRVLDRSDAAGRGAGWARWRARRPARWAGGPARSRAGAGGDDEGEEGHGGPTDLSRHGSGTRCGWELVPRGGARAP